MLFIGIFFFLEQLIFITFQEDCFHKLKPYGQNLVKGNEEVVQTVLKGIRTEVQNDTTTFILSLISKVLEN